MIDVKQSLAHTTWNCKYHIVFAPKYRRKVFYKEKRKEVETDLEQAIRKARSCGMTEAEIRELFELILED